MTRPTHQHRTATRSSEDKPGPIGDMGWIDCDDDDSDGSVLVTVVVVSALICAAGILYVAIGGAF